MGSEEEHTATARSAVAGNNATGVGFDDLFKGGNLFYFLKADLNVLWVHSRMGEENAIENHIRGVAYLFSYVLKVTVENFSPVFFAHDHLIVFHNNAGTEL